MGINLEMMDEGIFFGEVSPYGVIFWLIPPPNKKGEKKVCGCKGSGHFYVPESL